MLTTGSDITPADGCDFEIEFKDATANAQGTDTDDKVVFFDSNGTQVDVKDGDKIVVVYWAKVSKSEQVETTAALWADEYDQGAETVVKDNLGEANISEQRIQDHNGNGRNDNYTVLTYGNKSHTQWDKASATVYELDIAKTDAYDVTEGAAEDYTLLKDAKFRVYKATTDQNKAIDSPADEIGAAGITLGTGATAKTYYQEGKALLFAQATNFNADAPVYRYEGDVATGEVSATPAGTQLVSGKGNAMRLEGLEAGHYILVEEEAPAGYNKLAHPIVVTITDDVDSDGEGDFTEPEDNEGCLYYGFKANDGNERTGGPVGPMGDVLTGAAGTYRATSDGTNANGGLRVVNQAGQELPSTGGIGTTIFYVAGTVLVVGAAVMLVAKRRMGAEA